MKSRHKRFAMIAAGVAAIGIAVALVLNAFQSNLVFFFTPSQIVANEAPVGRSFRVGGMVLADSVLDLTACFTLSKCWPSTMKTTCRPRQPMRSNGQREKCASRTTLRPESNESESNQSMSAGLKATNINRCVAANINRCVAANINRCVAPLRLSSGPVPLKPPASCLVACKRLAYKNLHTRYCIQDRASKALPLGQRGMHAGMQGS